MPQLTSTFESHFLTHMQGVAGAYHKLIACSWVPILQVGGLGKVRVNCFPKAFTTWLGWESNPRPPDSESDALTTVKILYHKQGNSRPKPAMGTNFCLYGQMRSPTLYTRSRADHPVCATHLLFKTTLLSVLMVFLGSEEILPFGVIGNFLPSGLGRRGLCGKNGA